MGKDLTGKSLPSGISQRKDGRFCGRFVNRFGKRRCVYGKTVSEVKRKMAQEQANDNRGKGVYDTMTLDEWHRIWMESYVSELSRATISSYETEYRIHVRDILGWREMDSIRPIDIKGLLAGMAEKGLSQSTIYAVRKILSGMFRAARENELVTTNPVSPVKLPKAREEEHLRALTVGEQNLLLSESHRCVYDTFIRAQLSSGLRCGELAGLDIKDIDFSQRIIHVRQALSRYSVNNRMVLDLHPPKTKTSIRSIPMTDMFEQAVKAELKHRPEMSSAYKERFGGLVFRNSAGNPVTTGAYNEALKRLVDDINALGGERIDHFSSHCLRHTFCTRLIENNVSPKTVQYIMGHANVSVTMQIYTHVQHDYLKGVGDKIRNLF